MISQFNGLETRSDIGQLWENFVVMERMKKRAYHRISANQFFWRTYNQQEIDLVEERDGKLFGYESKWSAGSKGADRMFDVRPPSEWATAYPEALFEVVTPANYLQFVT